ncbi:MAG: hypothetical protein A2Y62_13505 [Candidatus Fischerbacteria bacterium RBG_13_37_8]|uniref:Uncharacterized protein n=1 Tax=Candidatus Fischerbacteria bacterium RBG_13_37_8 TaxID=1817863 RepID=A0A1F5VMY5_9BACT|nr:MAG: hypothetical protein A2Y62_13505 [Candidatus Fischerbacteria bacterium RBG_13_37_8]
MQYLEWNNLIAKHFFNESKAGKEVLLYINDGLINYLGESFGFDVDDFIKSVKDGPIWATRSGFCQKALQSCEGWRDKGLDYPPYISYLAFFVLAAVTETDYAPHSYYPGFRKRLNESQDSAMPPSFDRIIDLWDDLEKWSREDKHEELGRFVARIRGGYMHVGLPRSQTVLSEYERKHLPNLFDRANLDPTDAPSPEIIPKILRKYGEDILEKRTFKLLNSTQAEDIALRKALIEVVLDELEDWDGAVEEVVDEEAQPRLQVHTGLRLCIKLDTMAAHLIVYVRFKTSRMFPEDGLNFKGRDGQQSWFCREAYQGWSTPLTDATDGSAIKLDGSSLNWNEGALFVDSDNQWRARLRGADVRLFRPGAMDGLPDWVETQKLERGKQFLIAVSQRLEEKIRKWGEEHCEHFREERISGLPSRWSLFHMENASASCSGIDILSISTSARLVLIEGIKSSRGNTYFKFAPPKVVIENSSGSENVTMNGVQLRQPDVQRAIWVLPGDMPVGIPLRIEVNFAEHRLSKIIRLEEFGFPASFDKTAYRDSDGRICEDDVSANVCGSIVYGEIEHISYPSVIPTHLGDKIFFLGEKPGKIVDWPHEAVPSSWNPVWAIVCRSRKQWDVFFCGTPEQLRTGYSEVKSVGDRQSVKRWKEALWVRRKITVPPEIPDVRRIWEEYVRVARYV